MSELGIVRAPRHTGAEYEFTMDATRRHGLTMPMLGKST
jgi:hypothetical protein